MKIWDAQFDISLDKGFRTAVNFMFLLFSIILGFVSVCLFS